MVHVFYLMDPQQIKNVSLSLVLHSQDVEQKRPIRQSKLRTDITALHIQVGHSQRVRSFADIGII